MPKSGPSRNPWYWTVLTLLHERPMHPYEMQQLARARGKNLLALHRPGSLYTVVERLRADGMIEEETVERAGKLPERTIYRVTGEGRATLLDWLHTELGGLDQQDLPRFGFAVEKLAHLDTTTAARLLNARAAAIEAQLAELDVVRSSASARDVPSVSLVEIGYAHAVRRAEIDWLRHTVTEIEEGRLSWTPVPEHPG